MNSQRTFYTPCQLPTRQLASSAGRTRRSAGNVDTASTSTVRSFRVVVHERGTRNRKADAAKGTHGASRTARINSRGLADIRFTRVCLPSIVRPSTGSWFGPFNLELCGVRTGVKSLTTRLKLLSGPEGAEMRIYRPANRRSLPLAPVSDPWRPGSGAREPLVRAASGTAGRLPSGWHFTVQSSALSTDGFDCTVFCDPLARPVSVEAPGCRCC